MLTPEQARESSYRNIITRALGHRSEVEVDIFQFPLRPEDRILLCSDGLHGVVESDELVELAGAGPLKRDVDALIALANERGGPDNITVVLIEVIELGDGPSGGTVRTERMPGRSAGTAQMRTGQSQGTTAGVRKQRPAQAVAASSPKPKPVRPSSPPPRASCPAIIDRRHDLYDFGRACTRERPVMVRPDDWYCNTILSYNAARADIDAARDQHAVSCRQ